MRTHTHAHTPPLTAGAAVMAHLSRSSELMLGGGEAGLGLWGKATGHLNRQYWRHLATPLCSALEKIQTDSESFVKTYF